MKLKRRFLSLFIFSMFLFSSCGSEPINQNQNNPYEFRADAYIVRLEYAGFNTLRESNVKSFLPSEDEGNFFLNIGYGNLELIERKIDAFLSVSITAFDGTPLYNFTKITENFFDTSYSAYKTNPNLIGHKDFYYSFSEEYLKVFAR